MADYISSLLLAYQGKVDQRLNAPEVREIEIPILQTALQSADLALGGVTAESIRQSTKRAVDTYALNRFASTGGTARAVAPTGSQGNSNQVAITWVTFSESDQLWKDTGMDNKFSTEEMFENQVSQMQRNLRERIGAYIVQELHNNRSQVSRAVVDGRSASSILGTDVTWDGVNYCYQVSSNLSSRFFQAAANVMKQNYYYDKLQAVADPLTYNNANFLMNQGVGNAINYDFQFSDYLPGKDGIMFHPSLGTTVSELGVATGGTAIVVPTGTNAAYSVIPWIPMLNRQGVGLMDSFNGGFGTISDDKGYDLTYAVRGWAQKADGSGNGATLQSVVNYMELSVDIAFIAAPMPTNSGETPIIEFVQV